MISAAIFGVIPSGKHIGIYQAGKQKISGAQKRRWEAARSDHARAREIFEEFRLGSVALPARTTAVARSPLSYGVCLGLRGPHSAFGEGIRIGDESVPVNLRSALFAFANASDLADMRRTPRSHRKAGARRPGVRPGFRLIGLATPRTFNRCR